MKWTVEKQGVQLDLLECTVEEHVKRVEQRVVAMEKKQDKMSDTLKDFEEESFSIKGSSYEVCNTSKTMWLKLKQGVLRAEAAKLFCSSLTRDPPASDIQVYTYT